MGRVQQKKIERLLEEGRRLKAQVLESNGGAPIRLTTEERRRLDAMRKGIDPRSSRRSICLQMPSNNRRPGRSNLHRPR
jgi:hypothetical protein